MTMPDVAPRLQLAHGPTRKDCPACQARRVIEQACVRLSGQGPDATVRFLGRAARSLSTGRHAR